MLDVTAAVRKIRVPHEPYLHLESFHDLRVMHGANKDFPRRSSTDGNVWLFCDHNFITFLWAQNEQLLQANIDTQGMQCTDDSSLKNQKSYFKTLPSFASLLDT